MALDLLTILIFGFISFLFTQPPKLESFNRLDIILVVLLILVANLQGDYGFIGIGEFRLYFKVILQGIIAGMIVKRMTGRLAPTSHVHQ